MFDGSNEPSKYYLHLLAPLIVVYSAMNTSPARTAELQVGLEQGPKGMLYKDLRSIAKRQSARLAWETKLKTKFVAGATYTGTGWQLSCRPILMALRP